MLLSLESACNVLHIDQGDNDDLVKSLLEAIPSYIKTTTGMLEDDQEDEPLCITVAGFILTLWYYADHSDDLKLQRTIDNLLKCIALKAKRL